MASVLTPENPCANGCGKTEGKILGRGMCSPCYQKVLRAEKNATPEKKDETSDLGIMESKDDSEFIEDFGSSETRPGSIPNSPTNQGGSENEEKEGPLGKLKGLFTGKSESKSETFTPKTKERRPGGKGKRESGAETIGAAWAGIGGAISRFPRHRPSGMMIQLQSQAAGEILDDAIKGTFLDNMFVQKAVKAKDRLSAAQAIFFPPAIVFAIEARPDRAEQLLPLLRMSLANSLPLMVAPMKKAQKREEDNKAAMAELFPDLPEGADPIDYVLSMIFGDYLEPKDEQQSEEEQK